LEIYGIANCAAKRYELTTDFTVENRRGVLQYFTTLNDVDTIIQMMRIKSYGRISTSTTALIKEIK